ncbi:hypothetical protein DFH09DRAFT_1280767 [Mycena vulgaris]|nr:hypothetical protein DFH09DRAFT_1280767 [Mycena vulgaris]
MAFGLYLIVVQKRPRSRWLTTAGIFKVDSPPLLLNSRLKHPIIGSPTRIPPAPTLYLPTAATSSATPAASSAISAGRYSLYRSVASALPMSLALLPPTCTRYKLRATTPGFDATTRRVCLRVRVAITVGIGDDAASELQLLPSV